MPLQATRLIARRGCCKKGSQHSVPICVHVFPQRARSVTEVIVSCQAVQSSMMKMTQTGRRTSFANGVLSTSPPLSPRKRSFRRSTTSVKYHTQLCDDCRVTPAYPTCRCGRLRASCAKKLDVARSSGRCSMELCRLSIKHMLICSTQLSVCPLHRCL